VAGLTHFLRAANFCPANFMREDGLRGFLRRLEFILSQGEGVAPEKIFLRCLSQDATSKNIFAEKNIPVYTLHPVVIIVLR
jgi:hypothetical protein